jgi:dihydroflavonol-4-reductase
VRDITATDQHRHLRELGVVDLVEADLNDDAGWESAMTGCSAVLHTASPFFITDNEEELVRPAVDGTLRVLRAAAAADVRRVVLTSSTAAVVNTEAETYSEAQWSDPDSCSPYPKSKTLAELAAWAFVEEQAPDQRLELVACNPCLILGPLLSDRSSLSLDAIERLLSRKLPAVPNLGFSVVDVRDVATAHRLALESPDAPGNRYILMSGHLWMRDMALILKEAFEAEGFRPPTLPLPYPLLWLAARFDPTVRSILPSVGEHKVLDSSKARQELGWSPRPVTESVIATGRSLIDRKLVSA